MVSPKMKITEEDRAELEKEILKDKEEEREMLVSPAFIRRLANIACKADSTAHWAMAIAIIALIIAVLALP